MKLVSHIYAFLLITLLAPPVLSEERKYKTVAKPSKVYKRLHKFKGVEVKYPKMQKQENRRLTAATPRRAEEETFAPMPPTGAPVKEPKLSKAKKSGTKAPKTKAGTKSTKSTKAPKEIEALTSVGATQTLFAVTTNGIENQRGSVAMVVAASAVASFFIFD